MDLRTDKTARAALYSALFRPRSVGLVGLSSDRQRPTGRVLDYLRRAGYGGDIYVVTPKRDEVQGARAYPNLRDLPEVPEHVYVLLGTRLAEGAVAVCAAIGVKVVTVLADGFAETGAAGAARQREMVETARAAVRSAASLPVWRRWRRRTRAGTRGGGGNDSRGGGIRVARIGG